jgi:hypothetical protein
VLTYLDESSKDGDSSDTKQVTIFIGRTEARQESPTEK